MARMKRSAWILASIVALVLLVAWLVLRPRSESVVLDLVEQFPQAVEVRPTPEVFSIIDATLAGETKRAIHAKDGSRVAWDVTIPDGAWLTFSAGLIEEAWKVPGNGVQFRVSVFDDEILNVVINPYEDESARRWQDFELDLSEYAGENVKLFLKTFPGARGDNAGDLAVWGTPRIVTK
jgi:hypothetical protein